MCGFERENDTAHLRGEEEDDEIEALSLSLEKNFRERK